MNVSDHLKVTNSRSSAWYNIEQHIEWGKREKHRELYLLYTGIDIDDIDRRPLYVWSDEGASWQRIPKNWIMV